MREEVLQGAAISSPFSESTAFVLTPMLSRLQFGNYADAGPLAHVPQGTQYRHHSIVCVGKILQRQCWNKHDLYGLFTFERCQPVSFEN